ncbi:MAG: hypothetical protein SFU25_06435 [Candidatus Caenarcaniphilales bacterium]|nr:hypothetical protein [Candidatus Caenarcaniphilales bacterium]
MKKGITMIEPYTNLAMPFLLRLSVNQALRAASPLRAWCIFQFIE